MKRNTLVMGILVTASVLSLGLATIAATGNEPSSAHPRVSGDDSIIIDPEVGETFTPYGSVEAPPVGIMNAVGAYQRYAGGSTHVPQDSSVQLGYLTLPLGPGAPDQYTAKDQLVYAYTLAACGPQIGPAPNPEGKSDPGRQAIDHQSDSDCTQWLFLDAATGDLVDLTWPSSGL